MCGVYTNRNASNENLVTCAMIKIVYFLTFVSLRLLHYSIYKRWFFKFNLNCFFIEHLGCSGKAEMDHFLWYIVFIYQTIPEVESDVFII